MSVVCGARYRSKEEEFAEDGQAVRWPHRIGRTMLLCGPKRAFFPRHLHVGPDWPCMLVTYALIIGITALFIVNVGAGWGAGVVVPTVMLALLTVICFSLTACSDPGIVLRPTISDPEDVVQVEDGVPRRITHVECQFCKVPRPMDASHCYDCGVCIEGLDHHCPWTGKCIGKKTLLTFRLFLGSLWTLIIFVVLFVVITAVRGDSVVH